MLRRLRAPDAPRVLTSAMMSRLCADAHPGIAATSVLALVGSAEDLGVVRRVRNGLYLNRAAAPPAVPAEAAQHIRRGAVVSLHSVLGDAGILNNPTDIVFGIVPIIAGAPPPRVGDVETDVGTFRFHAIPERALFAGQLSDRLDMSVPYPRATPEAALCHWLYLARSCFSYLTQPSPEADVADLDRKRLDRLALATDIHDDVRDWLARADAYDEDAPDYDAALGL